MANNKYIEGFEHLTINEVDLAQPKMQEILILNDDYTTSDFVVNLLVRVFDKSLSEATNITQHIHHNGNGSCGIYPYDIAELKYSLAKQIIKDNGMPLRLDIRDV